MQVKKFSELKEEELDRLIDIHFSHWSVFNPKMKKEDTIYKFRELYTKEELPFGMVLINEEKCIVGFCVFKMENLKKYPEIYPWVSDVMIIEKYRGKGYGKILIQEALKMLHQLGYQKAYVWTDQAPEFYKKLGFQYVKQVEKNEGGYGELYSIDT